MSANEFCTENKRKYENMKQLKVFSLIGQPCFLRYWKMQRKIVEKGNSNKSARKKWYQIIHSPSQLEIFLSDVQKFSRNNSMKYYGI